MKYLLALSLLLSLAACAGLSPQAPGSPYPPPPASGQVPGGAPVPGGPAGGPVSPGQPVPVPEVKPPLLPSYPRNIEASGAAAPVLSLVRSARDARKAGKPEAAASSLERALRIEPRNPWVWQALAGLHLQLGQAEQAESEAQKANSLARRNPWIEVENWRVIAAARSLRGNAAGAAQAEARHEDLQRLLIQPPLAP
ncbi:MAG: tetratricopeptide repeat protein [Stagnimonas sp.]|nr:tetratricopeptide repeat protein [Stagnimonas sp.]